MIQSILRSDLCRRLVTLQLKLESSCAVAGGAVGSTPSLPHCRTAPHPRNDQELPQININRISTFCCNSCCFQVLAKITSVCMELELMSRICSEPLGDFPNYSPC